MSTERTDVVDQLCPQCYGREWVVIKGHGVICTCVTRRVFDDASERSRARARRRRREDRAAGG